MMNEIYIVGIGPGGISDMTPRAVAAIDHCDVICGYDRYIDLLGEMAADKQVIKNGMRGEVKRCQSAISLARDGHSVAVVCSGDAGIYGMAGLIQEMLSDDTSIRTEVVPGITAAISGAALLGAPLMNDFAVISLSDQLTPWDRIEKRVAAVAAADMVVVFYNPMSHHRPDTLKRACEILLESRPEDTVCGWVKNIGRDGQKISILTLGELKDTGLDMLCTVFIGASDTKNLNGRMVTVRGYDI